MIDGFEIKCQRCGNIAIDIKGTAVNYGAKVKVKFTCLTCSYEIEVPVTQKSLSDFLMVPVVYQHFNKHYRKIGRHEKIEEGAMQSWNDNELRPIQNPETIGGIPASFSNERDFYNPI